MDSSKPHIVIIGGGYTGLSAAFELSKKNFQVTIIEKENEIGGLARTFEVESNIFLERFYHHWFTNDIHIINLIAELGLSKKVIWNKTNTGMFFANKFYKLSSPIDLLKFSALSFINRLRLGFLTIKARRIKNWKTLESQTAENWLINNGGKKVFDVVWDPLLKGKFGQYKEQISAVWIWNKLKLRGGSRDKTGGESLAYFKGGFAALTIEIKKRLISQGVRIITSKEVKSILHNNNSIEGVKLSESEIINCKSVITTIALPLFNEIFQKSNFSTSSNVKSFSNKLSSIKYIGNVCLVIVMNESLSNSYWTNVNDPDFPFVAVIEHTNFEPPRSYKGKHIVYLSKYLPVTDEIYSMNKNEFLNFSLPYLKKMFVDFKEEVIEDFYLWKEPYSQPIVTKNYSSKIPPMQSPINNLFVSCMAQIYPEDRGTNYAVKYGKMAAELITKKIN